MKAKVFKTEQLDECMDMFMWLLTKLYENGNEHFFVPFSTGECEGLIIPHRTGSGYSVELLIDEIDSAAIQE